MVKSSSYDLLPGRIQSEWSVLFERTAAVVIGLIVTAAVIIAMVEGFANKRLRVTDEVGGWARDEVKTAVLRRAEHVFMAVVLCMVSVFWGMVTRKYLQDVFQERNIVYFGGLALVMVATATMLYALHWGPVALTPAEQALQSCTTGSSSCYNSQVQNSFGQGGCIEFPSSLNGGEPGRGSGNGQNCMAWQNTSLSFLAMFAQPPINTTVSCAQASAALQKCGLQVNCSGGPRVAATTPAMLAAPPQETTPMPATTPLPETTTPQATVPTSAAATESAPAAEAGGGPQTTPPGSTVDPGRS